MRLPKIDLGRSLRRKLQAEFPDITRQSIRNALCYYTDNPRARAIRKRAKELLREELMEIERYEE